MTVEKLNLPAKENAVQQKVNEIIDNLGSGSGGSVTVDATLSTTSENPVQNKVITTELNKKIEGISSSDVTTALGYTPYNSSNPSGYQANKIETIKVNGTAQTITSKAVNITVPTKASDINALPSSTVIPTISDTYSATSSNGMSGKAVASAISGKANSATSLSGYGITDAYTKTEIDGKLASGMHYKGTKTSYSNLPTTGNETGDLWNVSDTGANYAWNGTGWDKLSENIDLSGYVPTSRTINGKALGGNISLTASDVGAISDISSSDVIDALGYTPYNATNPNGYTSNVGTITGIKMNGSSKGTSGVVDLGTVITAHQDISGKQDALVSGTNIKTINGNDLLGSGDIEINGSSITVDTALSSTSENPVQNKVINTALGGKQATLVSGTNIKTINGNSLLGSGDIEINGSSITVDTALSSESENPVQNKVVNSALNGKQNSITGAASTITTSNLTTSRALISNASGKVATSAVTSTQLGYLSGATSNIQTQLNGKEATSNKVTSLSSSSTDTQYPSAKCVYDTLQSRKGVFVASYGETSFEDVLLAFGAGEPIWVKCYEFEPLYVQTCNVLYQDDNDNPKFTFTLNYAVYDIHYQTTLTLDSNNGWNVADNHPIGESIIDSYVNGDSGYNIYSNGYCEQWGLATVCTGNATATSISFLKEFKDTNYNITSGLYVLNQSKSVMYNFTITTKNTSAFSYVMPARSSGNTVTWGNGCQYFWRACGYIN